MELTLNVAWCVIAATSYALLARRVSRLATGPSRGASRCHCIVALSCALAILFPVISLTDDLHDMQAAAEEPSTSCVVMKRCGANHPPAPVNTSHQLPCGVSSSRTGACWIAFGNIAPLRAAHRSLVLPSTTLGRAPPLFVLVQIS
jgi:hypothetical protein